MCDAVVIIPHYNDVVRLMRCLAALMPQTHSGIEVVVVDNGSTDDLKPIQASYPGLRLLCESQKGAAHARNRGVVETLAPHLFFIDSDCLPADDWLTSACAALKLGDIVGGQIDVFDETSGLRTGAQAFEAVFAFDNHGYVRKKGFSVTANLVTRRDVFDATGPFFDGLSEDLDWCRRAVSLGHCLAYDAQLRVSHPSRKDWLALKRKWRRLTEEGFNTNGKGVSQRAFWIARALLMPGSILLHAPRVLRHPTLRDARERWRALLTLARLRVTRMGWMLKQALRE